MTDAHTLYIHKAIPSMKSCNAEKSQGARLIKWVDEVEEDIQTVSDHKL